MEKETLTMNRILGKRGRTTIPYPIRQRVGFRYNDVLTFTECDDGQSVIIRREDICCGCKEQPPLVEERNLQEVLSDLTFEEQMAAFFFLTRLLSDRQTR